MANYRHGATYGSLAYDLDALAREKQLDEAGKLPQKKVRPAQPEVQPVQRRQSAARAAVRPSPVLLLGTVLSLIAASFIPNKPEITNGLICMTFFLAGLAAECGRHGTALAKDVLKAIDYETLALLAGLFLVIRGIERAGIIDDLSNIITGMGGGNLFLTYTIIVWASVLISAFVDNIPYTATMLPVVGGVAASLGVDQTVLCFGLLVGATLGGNLTPVGASANIAACGILRREGYEVSAGQFMRIGVPFTLTAVLTGYVLCWLFYAGLGV